MRKKRIFAFLQSTALILLFALLLFQGAFYIKLAENIGSSGLEPFPESEAYLLGKVLETHGTSYLISPYFTAIVAGNDDGTGFFSPVSDSTGAEIWQYFAEVLKNSAKGSAKQIIFSDVNEKNAYLDSLYLHSKNCYYVKLLHGIETSVLMTFLADSYDVLPENPDFVISDMFLVGGANGEASLIAVDNYGEVLKIFPSRNIPFNSELCEAYNTNENRFHFVNLGLEGDREIRRYFPVLDKSLYSDRLTVSEANFFVNPTESSKVINMLLEMFAVNSYNSRSYTTADGDLVFVQDAVRIRASRDGVVEYTSERDGTPTEELLKYYGVTADEEYSGIAKVARLIAHKLTELLSEMIPNFGGQLNLYDVSYSDGICSFSYNYTVNGIPIKHKTEDSSENSFALRLDFSRDKLVSAKINIKSYSLDGQAVTDMPQRSALAVMAESLDGLSDAKINYFGPEYVFFDDSNISRLTWSITTEREAQH